MAPWTYPDIWLAIAAAHPRRPAIVQGERSIDWRAFDSQASALAASLVDAGVRPGGKVGIYLPNRPEYLVTLHAALKISRVPFNMNHRYGADEIAYLVANADAEAVVFDIRFAGIINEIRHDLPSVRTWIAVANDGETVPAWANDFAEVIGQSDSAGPDELARSGDDLIIIYTGGTTGRPKGVMWRQKDLLGVGNYCANPAVGLPPLASPEQAGERAFAHPPLSTLVACPLMHGTGMMSAIAALNSGGFVALLPSYRFNPVELWDEAARLRVARISIVGMAFAGPMLEVLDANKDRWDLTSIRNINSSGTMWSVENKTSLLRHLPQATLTDTFASSEGFQMAVSHSTAADPSPTAQFSLGPNCAVFTEAGTRVEPGSDEIGMAAVGGHIPLGYYKDPEKTAHTFPTIEGRRWSMPGDWARVAPDGTLVLLGRGSQCVNTGGEKVYPEEVEEALKRHEAVRDAAVIGVPDPRFGEKVCAVVQFKSPAANPGLAELAGFVRRQLADFKAPRILVSVPDLARAPNGKLDYEAIRKLADEHGAVSA